MKTKVKQQPVSNTIQSKTAANRQAPAQQILQRYQNKTVQRQDIDEEDLLQGKFEDIAQRMELDELDEEIPLQRKEPVNNTGLPDNLKTGIENLSGFSMDDVRVHYNSGKPAQLQALAYTQGTDIHVGPGQERHLPHEAWHVVQQKQGRVQPTMQLQGVNVNDNEGLEREADLMGQNFFNSDFGYLKNIKSNSVNDKVIQGKFWVKKQDSYEWHPEEVNENLYLKTDELKKRYISRYPVYIERVLDLRESPKIKDNDAVKNEIESGNIVNEQLKTMSSIYCLLDSEQKNKFDDCIDGIKGYCNNIGITSIIEGALKNVKNGSILKIQNKKHPDTTAKLAKEIFIKRLELMTNYVKEIGEKLGKEEFWIESTGADPHANGEHALFLIDRGTDEKKKLYKPHSLQLENVFSGKHESIISEFNKHTDRQLPIMNFDTSKHTEDFITRVGTYHDPLDEEQIQNHFIKLGILEVLASTFGITDLHGENVMFSNEGPIIIDGECGGWYGDTCIESGVGVTKIDENGMFTNPSALYKTLESKPKQVMQTEYEEYIQKGKEIAKDILVQNEDSFIDTYQRGLKEVDNFRIVPIQTKYLGLDLQLYIFNGDSDSNKISQSAYKQVCEAMQSENWAFNNVGGENIQVNIDENSFIAHYSTALEAGTLPAFTFQMNNTQGESERDINIKAGSILLDGHIIGYINSEETFQNKFTRRVKEIINSYKDESLKIS